MQETPLVKLRQALPADSDFAYEAKRAAFRPYVEAAFGWDEDIQRELHQRRYTSEDFRIVLADGRPVGVVALAINENTLTVHQLFIHPDNHSKGIGRQVMQIIMTEANYLALPINLRVLRTNPRALSFYESIGFERESESEHHINLIKHRQDSV